MSYYNYLLIAVLAQVFVLKAGAQSFVNRAIATFDSISVFYGVKNTPLLRENYPFGNDKATYLANGEGNVNAFSYLWPYSGSLSACVALYDKTKDKRWLQTIDRRVIKGLDCYRDAKRKPCAYASYINTAPESDRFYDDNIWLGIDFTQLYLATGKAKYLKRAEEIWRFIESGMDDKLGGGIYWCEQKKTSKNTCSNAPGTVLALKLYQATHKDTYLAKAKALYQWTRTHLEDSADYLYFDNISLNGHIGRAKYAYNTGQMLQAATLLYRITKDESYLRQARLTARAAYMYFFEDQGRLDGLRRIKDGNIWFSAVMMRGYAELACVDSETVYMNAFKASLDDAWNKVRDAHGLYGDSFTHPVDTPKRWLLTQFAFVEMMASFE